VRGSVNGERNGKRTIPRRHTKNGDSRICLRQGGDNRAAHAVVAGIGARFPIVLIIVRTCGIAPGFGCRSHLRPPWPFKDLGEDRSGRKLDEKKNRYHNAHRERITGFSHGSNVQFEKFQSGKEAYSFVRTSSGLSHCGHPADRPGLDSSEPPSQTNRAIFVGNIYREALSINTEKGGMMLREEEIELIRKAMEGPCE
jgi:hypothetical protein